MHTIRISDADYERIITWKQEHKNDIELTEFKLPFDSGNIIFTATSIEIRFELKKDDIFLQIKYIQPVKATTNIKAKISNKGINANSVVMSINEKNKKNSMYIKYTKPKTMTEIQFVSCIITLFENVCWYTISPDKSIAEDQLWKFLGAINKLNEEPVVTKPKKRLKRYDTKSNTIKITKSTKYKKSEAKESARKYERHTDSWSVRGFYRHYKKSGKRVWVEAHTKGKGKVKDNKYVI